MPVDQVIDLLTRWRTSSGMRDRGRLVRETVQTLRRLTPDERRTVARSLAERGVAPALANRLDDAAGGPRDIRPNELVRGLVSMDRAQVDELIADLRDADTRNQLAQDAFDRLTDPPPDSPPADPELIDPGVPTPGDAPAPPPPPPVGPPIDGTPPASRKIRSDAGATAATAGLLHRLGSDVAERGRPAVADPAEAAVHDDEAQDDATNVDASPPSPAPAPTDARTPAAVDAILPDDEQDDEVAVGTTLTTASPAAGRSTPVAAVPAATPGHGRPVLADGGEHLLARVREATTANGRLSALPRGRRTADGRRFARSTVVQLLDAVPDGWQRRRFAVRLAELDAIPPDAIEAALGAFARASDATFVAGAMVANAAVHPDALAGLIDDRALRRLQIRAGR